MNETVPSALPVVLKQLRPLKWDERVRRGDFVADEGQGFQLWEGPSGFRADAFQKQIYRRLGRPPAAIRKSS